jgi:hypothetical protein
MYERGITADDVREVVESGEAIEMYPEDLPYPSRLMLGWRGTRPIHVVVAENQEEDEVVVVTVYEPEEALWAPGFRRRKS